MLITPLLPFSRTLVSSCFSLQKKGSHTHGLCSIIPAIMSLLVLLDISATFDTVDHGILLGRLSELGIGGLALAWLWSFLEGHPQRVQPGENVSAPRSLNCGVPQGWIISSMLFNVNIRLLDGVIRGCGASCHQYADDTQLYISFFLSAVDPILSL